MGQGSNTAHAEGDGLCPLAVDAEQAARLCNISRSQFYALWGRGQTPEGHKLGGKRLFPLEELRAWVEAGFPPRGEWSARWATQRLNRRLNGIKKRRTA